MTQTTIYIAVGAAAGFFIWPTLYKGKDPILGLDTKTAGALIGSTLGLLASRFL